MIKGARLMLAVMATTALLSARVTLAGNTNGIDGLNGQDPGASAPEISPTEVGSALVMLGGAIALIEGAKAKFRRS
jgi:hypothetical protein